MNKIVSLLVLCLTFLPWGCANSLRSEFKALNARTSATDSISAKAEFEEVREFVERLKKEEKLPDGLLKDAMVLKGKRALLYARLSAEEKISSEIDAVLDALRSSDVDHSKVESDPKVKEYLKSVDPSSDKLEDYK